MKTIIVLILLCPFVAEAGPAKTSNKKANVAAATVARASRGTRTLAVKAPVARSVATVSPEMSKAAQTATIEIDEGD
ncbi:MAG: hypothetical protein AAB250_17205 [Bdellovibrionota bacterium]